MDQKPNMLHHSQSGYDALNLLIHWLASLVSIASKIAFHLRFGQVQPKLYHELKSCKEVQNTNIDTE